MSLRKSVIKLAYDHPELRDQLLPVIKEAGFALTAEPRYRDYVRRWKGPGQPMKREDWEVKVLGKKRPAKGEGEGAAKGEKKQSTPQEHVDVIEGFLEGWNIWDGEAGEAKANTILKKLQKGTATVDDIDAMTKDIQRMKKEWQKGPDSAQGDMAEVVSALGSLKEIRKHLKKTKTPSKSYTKSYAKPVTAVMDKHSLTDDDAAEVKSFKSRKPAKGMKQTPAQLMQKFLSKAKPETKERMKGVSPADFVKMLGAIMDDTEGEGKMASSKPKPKFELGDWVRSKMAPSQQGEVSYMGPYDDLNKGYTYKVLEEGGRRNYWNEKDMVKAKKPKGEGKMASSDKELLGGLVRLAHQHPEFRDALLPIIKQAKQGKEAATVINRLPPALWMRVERMAEILKYDQTITFAFCVALLRQVGAEQQAVVVDRLLGRYRMDAVEADKAQMQTEV